MNSHTLRFMLCTFLTQLRTHPAILTSPRNERIVSNLRKIMKRQRRFYRHLDTNDQQREPSWTGKLGRTIRKSASFSVYNHSLLCKPFHMDLCHSKLLSLITHQDNYKSVVLKYRSEIIAQQFCLIEKDMLQTVSWDELIELRWRKKGSSTRHSVVQDTNLKGVELLIDFFNKTCQWVTCEIVRSTLLETRVQVIEKFIRIAFKCYQHRNYSTLMQILLGLQSPAVTRLERTWERVNQVQKDLLNQLKELAKPFKNWKNIRDCMTKATEEVTESFAVECVLTQSLKGFEHVNGCIPFLGLYLSDLVFLAELPTFIKANADTNNEDYIEHDKKLYERLCHPLVNYNKFRITASVIKHVLTFQVLSRAYKFKIHQHLFTQLQTVSILDNSQIREASFLCE
ncbi:hypothetical protein RMATCC62417_03209 [Rhizopus microsporus]|nr:hypothetical protein RMATCC62417_03209 [Rhizopus microsporus]